MMVSKDELPTRIRTGHCECKGETGVGVVELVLTPACTTAVNHEHEAR